MNVAYVAQGRLRGLSYWVEAHSSYVLVAWRVYVLISSESLIG